MNIKVAGLTIRGIEESFVYQDTHALGYQDGFRDYLTRAHQEKHGLSDQETCEGLYQQVWLRTKRKTVEKWDFLGLDAVPDFQTMLREGYRDGFRACFELTFEEFHGTADEETFEHLYELAWRKALIAELRQLVADHHPAFEFVGAAVRIRHLSELERLWLDFNRIHAINLEECFGAFVVKRNWATDARQ